VYIDDLMFTPQLDGVQLTFSLPAGSYATVLLQEIMKRDIADDEPDAGD
jgi:tRNA pseudouridine13 synthase